MFDTTAHFGWLTILLHWFTAITLFGLFALGVYMVELTYYDSLYNKLPFIHKSAGILSGLLLLIRLIWKMLNTAPLPLDTHRPFERLGARLAHWVLHLSTIVIIVSGYLIVTAEGLGVSVFDWFSVPATVTTIPGQADLAGLIHKYVAYGMIGVALIHAAAALKHHLVDKDATLRRMSIG
jgi:cytochrome b561